MLRRVNFYTICVACGLCVLLILAGSRYADNTFYRPFIETRGNVRNIEKIEDGMDSFSQDIHSTYIKKALNQTRKQIKDELSTYDFSQSGVNVLENLVMESGGKPLQSLIISTWRSGTTFLGQLLNSIPGSYYHYEPLLKYGIIKIRGPPESDHAISALKGMLRCNYDGMEDYFTFGSKNFEQFSHNTRLWDHCKFKKKLCLDPEFTSRLCKLFPFHTMKVLRLRLDLIMDLLDDNEFNLKVILLIRDPRGLMQSRQHRFFCQPSPDCWEPSLVCADMISDYMAARRIQQQYPDKLMVLRFEELALQPEITTHQILNFLKLGATRPMDDFLKMHTKIDVAGVKSTYRVSHDVPFKWKNVLYFNYVNDIQMACKEAMRLWGYKMVHNETHMRSQSFYPLEDYKISP